MRGKEIAIKSSNEYTVKLGTVDNKKPKCVYLEIKGWITPRYEDKKDYQKSVTTLNKRIKNHIFKTLNTNLFNEIYFVDFDLRDSGIEYGKRSYYNCEITLYQKDDILTLNKLKSDSEKITSSLINGVFCDFDDFKFYKKK